MWLPTFKHTFPSPTPMKRPSTMTATTETTPIANDTTQPVTVMPTEASVGLRPRQFAGSAPSLQNLTPALCLS